MYENKKMKSGKIDLEILLLMIVIVVTSAAILFLVSSGLIQVKGNVQAEPILNAEFIPLGKPGYLALGKFEFCSFVDENFECLEEKNQFEPSEDVFVRFVVESSTYNGEVALVRNYQITNPLGEIVFEADQKNNYFFEINSPREYEPVVFADYFVLGADAVPGEYTLKVIIKNPLLEKEITVKKKFILGEA